MSFIRLLLSFCPIEAHLATSCFAILLLFAESKYGMIPPCHCKNYKKAIDINVDDMGHQIYWHGVPELIISKTKYHRSFWATVVILAAVGLTYESYHVINEYQNQPFLINFDPIYLLSQRIPDTVICPQDPLDTKKLMRHNFTAMEIAQLYQVFTPDYYTVPRGWYVVFANVHDPEAKIHAMNLSWSQFLDVFGVPCHSLLKHCMVNWQFIDCCKVAEPVMHRYFGRCFALRNLDKVMNQTAPFHFGGLVILAKNEPQANSTDPYGPITEGLHVEIAHNYTANTYEIFNVRSDEMLEIALTADKLIRHKTRPGGCLDWPNWQSRMTPHYCWNRGVMDVCNCTLPGYKNDQNKELCFPTKYSECDTTEEGVGLIRDQCERNMSVPVCSEWMYKPLIKTTKLGFHNYLYTQRMFNFSGEVDSKNKTLMNLVAQGNYSMICVYYTHLGYTEIRETSTYSIHRFISSIGGNMSLFLGASLISLVQLCLMSVTSTCSSKKKKAQRGMVGVATVHVHEKDNPV